MRLLSLTIVLFIQNCSFAQIKGLTVESTIQNVTVFTSGARIERLATVSIPMGRSEIIFTDLSNQLNQQSVQLQSDANITLLSVQTTKDFLHAHKMEQQENSYQDKISSLQDKIARDSKQLEVLKNEESMLIKNQEIGGQTGVKTPELKIALDFQRQRFSEIYQQELQIQKTISDEKFDLSNYSNQRSEISRKKDSVNYIVTALIESKEPKSIKFHLLYNIKDAGWYPTYDVRLNEVSQPLNILMNANVYQRSGETWKDVALWLSTGSPKDNATPSMLSPWLLNYYDPSVSIRSNTIRGIITGRITDESGQPVQYATVTLRGSKWNTISDANGYFRIENYNVGEFIEVSAVGYKSKIVAARVGYLTIVLSENVQKLQEVAITGYGISDSLAGRASGLVVRGSTSVIQTVGISTQYQPTTIVYKIDEKYTIETDNKTSTIGIKHFEIPAFYEYLSIPKTDPSAFLSAKMINWQNYDLQSGEASLYYEGNFLGKTYIDLGIVTDTLNLSLGKDNSIKISRKLVREFSSKKFLGSNRTDSRRYEISVKNTKKLPVTVTINDQIPISTNKEISVEDIKVPEGQLDKSTGIATWTFNLSPNEEKKLSISFNVKYPKESKVVLE
ncbi:MAG: DUF4139 domain-containing protein [Flavisolibacter sp.]